MNEVKILEGRSSFSFDVIALLNIKETENHLLKGIPQDGDNSLLVSALYAQMIFFLYVYLEGIINNGCRRLLEHQQTSEALKQVLKDKLKRNLDPFDTILHLDALLGTNFNTTLPKKSIEALKYHGQLRNLVAHGGIIQEDILHEFSSEAESFTVKEPVQHLKHLISYLKKCNIYDEQAAGSAYPTSIATEKIYNFFKKSITDLVKFLVEHDPHYKIGRCLLFSFDYEYFSLSSRYANSEGERNLSK